MLDIKFEWDESKNASNKRKHGVSFEEASTIFFDDYALLLNYPDHSAEEDRFILLGLSSSINILIVCHCYRSKDEIIRIISAGKANQSEKNQYINRWKK
jgi:uncharacterized DUF497 family protein